MFMKPVSAIDRYAIEKVRERRTALGLSQTQLSYMLNVSSSYIGQVESEKYKTRYTLERLNQIAKLLECRLRDLLPERPL